MKDKKKTRQPKFHYIVPSAIVQDRYTILSIELKTGRKPEQLALYLLCTSEDPEFHVETAGAQVRNDQPIVSVSGKV